MSQGKYVKDEAFPGGGYLDFGDDEVSAKREIEARGKDGWMLVGEDESGKTFHRVIDFQLPNIPETEAEL